MAKKHVAYHYAKDNVRLSAACMPKAPSSGKRDVVHRSSTQRAGAAAGGHTVAGGRFYNPVSRVYDELHHVPRCARDMHSRASFPLSNLTDDRGRSLAPVVSPQVLALIQEQRSGHSIAPTTSTRLSAGHRRTAVVLLLRSRDAHRCGTESRIEHASRYGRAPGHNSPQGKRVIGARAARAFSERDRSAGP